MLVCNVSLLRRRAAIAAGVVEAASALDAPGTGNVVFATLVDDPASVRDTVDAYKGQTMLEAANAVAIASVALSYGALVAEETHAADTVSGIRIGIVSAAINEPVTAAITQDAAVTAAPSGRSAMLPGLFVNPGASREAGAIGVMVNQ